MSDQALSASADSAKNITAKAASWIERSLHESWSEKDQQALDAWLAESPNHQIAYWRLESAWSETYRLAVLKPSAPRENPPPAGNMVSTIYKAAAAFLLIAALGGMIGGRYLTDKNGATYTTALGERKTLALSDGSRIELNTDTVLTTAFTAGERKVWIKRGEAYFHIRHDETRPFTIMVGDRKIVDIGTEFVVRRSPDLLRVAVLEGRVGFGDAKGQVNRELVSGDVAMARKDEVSVRRSPLADIVNGLSWREGKLVFHHTALRDAAAEFNRYNGEKLVVADAATGEITINGTFSTGDVHAFSRLAHAVLGLHVDDRGQAIVISRN